MRMVDISFALESSLQISSNSMGQNIIFSKFVNSVFHFNSIIGLMPMYSGLTFVKRAACRSINALLTGSSESLVIRL